MAAMSDFRLLRPASAADAVRLRGEFPASRFIAGGTDLLPNMRRGLVSADAVIDLGGIAELSELRVVDDFLHVGAVVTLAALAADPVAQARLPALVQAAASVAGPTHRAAATLGGGWHPQAKAAPLVQAWLGSLAWAQKFGQGRRPARGAGSPRWV